MLKHRSLKIYKRADPWVCSGRDAPESAHIAELDGNGDFFMGSTEGNRLMNKRQFYHRVLSGVRMDAQT